MFALLAERVFTLQIIKGADYQKNFIMLIKKPLSIEASRGNIYDVNGELLAYNQLAYSVVISDNGSYSSTKEHNRLLNKELNEIINVIKNNGGSIYNDFPVVLNDDGTYSFTFTSETSKRDFCQMCLERNMISSNTIKRLDLTRQMPAPRILLIF